MRSALHSVELADAAEGIPIHHVEIAVAIPVRAVGREELAGAPLLERHAVLRAQTLVGLLSEVRDEEVPAVEDRDAAREVGDDEIAVQLVRVARAAELLPAHLDQLAFQREELQA